MEQLSLHFIRNESEIQLLHLIFSLTIRPPIHFKLSLDHSSLTTASSWVVVSLCYHVSSVSFTIPCLLLVMNFVRTVPMCVYVFSCPMACACVLVLALYEKRVTGDECLFAFSLSLPLFLFHRRSFLASCHLSYQLFSSCPSIA